MVGLNWVNFSKPVNSTVFGINILSSEDIMYFQNKVLPLGTCGLGLLRYCNSILFYYDKKDWFVSFSGGHSLPVFYFDVYLFL